MSCPCSPSSGGSRSLSHYKGTACVVTAGNSGVRWPTWPSVFPQTISVGALAANGRDRADFSNYGGWVDVYIPGRDIVNANATGTYVYQTEPYKDGPPGKFYAIQGVGAILLPS